jgi:hypothetical protein
MKKKPPVLSFPKTKAVVQSDRSWHNGGDIEIALIRPISSQIR